MGYNTNKIRKSMFVLLFFLGFFTSCNTETGDNPVLFPEEHWLMYEDPIQAGWSAEGIKNARARYDEMGSASFMVIEKGKVVVAWGDYQRKYMCHSIRKSFLSALYGIHIAQGLIELDYTLDQLGIEDTHNLTNNEKKATIGDLLKARSGVFHPAAYETDAMKASRPERGTYDADEFWYYNNWDFNTLCTIMEEFTMTPVFEDFEENIADPLGMQDFEAADGYYHLEAEHSKYPAYPFRMSARDMARFGLLYLNKGDWDEDMIVPDEHVNESIRSYSDTGNKDGLSAGYGYLWWVSNPGNENSMFAAKGHGGHVIAIDPETEMVFVHRTDTYTSKRIPYNEVAMLIQLLKEAKTNAPQPNPTYIPLPELPSKYVFIDLEESEVESLFTGNYTTDNGEVDIMLENDKLIWREAKNGRTFELGIINDSSLMMLDSEVPVNFSNQAMPGSIEFVRDSLMGNWGEVIVGKEAVEGL